MNDQKTENNVTVHNSSVANYYAMEVDTHISDTIISDVDLFKCPNCKNFSIIDFKKAEYCFVCGQKIIWGHVVANCDHEE
uniref:Uncharacterized protein n=2 Tax=viral metagenome TaxID=1070528 RepID=A0A6M3JQP7_9ZZZZ